MTSFNMLRRNERGVVLIVSTLIGSVCDVCGCVETNNVAFYMLIQSFYCLAFLEIYPTQVRKHVL